MGELVASAYAGEILSFEPVTSAFEKLADAASADPKWRAYKLALGSEESTQTINVAMLRPLFVLYLYNEIVIEGREVHS